MSVEDRPSLPRREKAWRSTKEFLLSNPRSAEIREVCVGIVKKLDALVSDPDVANSQDRQGQLYAELELSGGRLIELGISPDMNVGEPQEVYQKNPVFTAEYVAGQLIRETGVNVVSESAAMPIVQEMNEAQSGSIPLVSGKNITPKLADFMIIRSIVNMGYQFLDIEEDGSHRD